MTARAERSLAARALDLFERVGNRLPDPVLLFVFLFVGVVALSGLLAGEHAELVDPRTLKTLIVVSQLTPSGLAGLLAGAVKAFTDFPPLGPVLVALLGVGVAEHAGLISAALRKLLAVAPRALLTPTLILVGLLSHTASDAGFVLVIPLGGVLFQAAGRPPLAGIAAAFAGVSGGFCANLLIAPTDPVLAGITQSAAQLLEPGRTVNPLCNWTFGAASALLIILLGWLLTDRFVEPRLAHLEIDGEGKDAAPPAEVTPREGRALVWALIAFLAAALLLVLACWPRSSPLRDATSGALTRSAAPLMKSIVPLIFLLAFVPGVVYGYGSGAFRSHRDVIAGMAKALAPMAYYLVLAFFAAQFLAAFDASNLGALVALRGASWLQELALPEALTLVGVVLLVAVIDFLVFSASAKWALLAPILVPMLMQLGLPPELTQAAYRIGDSTTNIVSPLMVYFPLVVVYCQRFHKGAGIGTLAATMLPYTLTFLVAWTGFLLLWWYVLDLPLGLG